MEGYGWPLAKAVPAARQKAHSRPWSAQGHGAAAGACCMSRADAARSTSGTKPGQRSHEIVAWRGGRPIVVHAGARSCSHRLLSSCVAGVA